MKTNKPGKQNILFLHVEKIVFGVLILATLYYCYSATSLPQISWTHQQLTQDATTAQQTIESSQFVADLVPANYNVRARDIRTGFPHANYRTVDKWEPAVFPEKVFRKNPEPHQLFTVVKLRAVNGMGAVMTRREQSIFDSTSPSTQGMSQDMGAFGSTTGMGTGGSTAADRIETAHWVLLTGLIPYEEQLREYTRLYANAMHSSAADYPTYLFIDIERNEIGDNNPDGSPRWVDIDPYEQFVENNKRWAGISPDPVDINYTLPPPSMDFQPMASRLPPLANRQFGPEVAYPPYIPLMSDSLRDIMIYQQNLQNMIQENQRNLTPEDIRKNRAGELDRLLGGSGTGTSDMSGTGGGMGTSGMYQGGGNAMNTGMTGRTGMGGDSFGSASGSGMGMATNVNDWSVLTKRPPSVVVNMKYRLFRFFDFTVEPGKSYQYRVKLGLKNPNYRLNDRFLTEEAAKTKWEPVLYTDFSLPSGKVAVNSNARILVQDVGSFPSTNRAWQAQNATIASIVYSDEDNEDYIAKNKSAAPGGVLNFAKTLGEPISSYSSPGGTSTPGGSSDMGYSSPSGTTPPTVAKASKTLDHVSGECLLDVVGKRRLVGSNAEHTPAGKVMVMAFDGTLSIRAVKEDKLELDRYEKKATTDTTMSGMGPR